MKAESFSGIWVFDMGMSELKSPPSRWMQIIQVEDDRIRVQEQITRGTDSFTVMVEAACDGEFYKVEGSPLVDEISYLFDGESIQGFGRKQGVVVLREVVSLSRPDLLQMSMHLMMHGKEIPLGEALFRRQDSRGF